MLANHQDAPVQLPSRGILLARFRQPPRWGQDHPL